MIIKINNRNGEKIARCDFGRNEEFGNNLFVNDKENVERIYCEDVETEYGVEEELGIDIKYNYDKKILNDLLNIVHSEGLCTGRWEENEEERELCVQIFLDEVEKLSDEYGLNYIKEIKSDECEFKIGEKVNNNNYTLANELVNDMFLELKKELISRL